MKKLQALCLFGQPLGLNKVWFIFFWLFSHQFSLSFLCPVVKGFCTYFRSHLFFFLPVCVLLEQLLPLHVDTDTEKSFWLCSSCAILDALDIAPGASSASAFSFAYSPLISFLSTISHTKISDLLFITLCGICCSSALIQEASIIYDKGVAVIFAVNISTCWIWFFMKLTFLLISDKTEWHQCQLFSDLNSIIGETDNMIIPRYMHHWV